MLLKKQNPNFVTREIILKIYMNSQVCHAIWIHYIYVLSLNSKSLDSEYWVIYISI